MLHTSRSKFMVRLIGPFNSPPAKTKLGPMKNPRFFFSRFRTALPFLYDKFQAIRINNSFPKQGDITHAYVDYQGSIPIAARKRTMLERLSPIARGSSILCCDSILNAAPAYFEVVYPQNKRAKTQTNKQIHRLVERTTPA